jgi:hypothetical protein
MELGHSVNVCDALAKIGVVSFQDLTDKYLVPDETLLSDSVGMSTDEVCSFSS